MEENKTEVQEKKGKIITEKDNKRINDMLKNKPGAFNTKKNFGLEYKKKRNKKNKVAKASRKANRK